MQFRDQKINRRSLVFADNGRSYADDDGIATIVNQTDINFYKACPADSLFLFVDHNSKAPLTCTALSPYLPSVLVIWDRHVRGLRDATASMAFPEVLNFLRITYFNQPP